MRISQTRIAGYSLTLHDGKSGRYDAVLKQGRKVIGVWRDFRPSPLHAIDSRDTWGAIWSFVTLREGDTDREYFDDYTETMIAFRDGDAEHVGHLARERFGDD